jgi:hypothetical protein
MKRHILTIGLAAVISALAFVPATALAAPASVNHTTYHWFVGEAPVLGPDVSMAPDGSTVTMFGNGTFNAGPDKSVTGGGNYTIKDASGATVAKGTWTATQMLGFVNYGNGVPQGTPANFYGGQAQMKVTLSGVGDGLLNINCTLGDPPGGHNGPGIIPAEEGIDLSLGNGLNFNREVSGETVFITP